MQPYIVGLAGGTGSGKTTVANKLAAGLPERSVALLEHDSYYWDHSDLSIEERAQLNYDHPDSLDTKLLIKHLRESQQGKAIEVPVYDFKTHARLPETQRIAPAPILIVEGILTFVEEELRNLFDLKIFVDTDADIRVLRRVRRDIEKRGRDFASIREHYYKTVRPMHLRFVEPSKRWADIIVPEGGENKIALDLIISKLRSLLPADFEQQQ